MENLFEVLVTSGIISALISGGIAYLQFQKEKKLKHITQERKEWRDKMREIVRKLHGANLRET